MALPHRPRQRPFVTWRAPGVAFRQPRL